MKKRRLVAFGLILSLCLFVVFLRINFLSLPALDKIARSEVYGKVWEEVKAGADKEYANVPQKKKDSLTLKLYDSYLKQNKHFLQDEIRQKTAEKKDFYRNDKGHTYVSGVDSYYWLRLIDNLIHKGHIGDSVKDGQDYDELVGMPIEKSLSRSMHLILGSLLYKFFGIFHLDIDYDIGFYFIPLLFSALLVIFAFLVTKMLRRSNLAAFLSATAICLSPLLLQRTMFEWLDTDIYNVFFPLLIFGAFLSVFKSGSTFKKGLGLLVFSLSCAFYASVWQGWWHIFDLLILCGALFILGDFSETKDKALFKGNMLWILLLFISGAALSGIINGKESFFSFFSGPRSIISALKDVPTDNWPNVFLTVAELKKISPYELAMEAGGIAAFFAAILGSAYLVFSDKILRDRKFGIGYFCMFIWLGVMYYVSLNALRLALLLVVPLGLMFGIAVDALTRKIFNFSRRFSKKIHFAIVGILALAIYHLFSSYVIRAADISYLRAPLMNDAWYKSIEFIKNDSADDAVINSWWDYGHWFKAIAGRKVLFDGKTQNSPVAYWVARALISNNEDEAVGILRMLNVSKNKAFDVLESYGFSHVAIVDMFNDILKLKESDARVYLAKIMDKNKVDELISFLYAEKMPPVYFVASFDMAAKIRAISHIGNWDFKKGDIWLSLKANPLQSLDYVSGKYGYTKEEARVLLRDLMLFDNREALGWVSKVDDIYSNLLSNKSKKAGNLVIFDNGATLDLSNYNVYISRGLDVDIGIPYSVVYLKGDTLAENIQKENNLSYSVLLFSDGDAYKNIFIDKNLAKSMFIRMYFLRGESLKYFKKAHEEKTPEGNYIYVYKIEWPN